MCPSQAAAKDLGLVLDKTVKLEWHKAANSRTRCLRITQKEEKAVRGRLQAKCAASHAAFHLCCCDGHACLRSVWATVVQLAIHAAVPSARGGAGPPPPPPTHHTPC